MRKIYIPYAHAKSVYDIDVSFFLKEKVNTIFLDLDNTLDSYRQKTPTQKAVELKENLEKAGIQIYILSNNTGKRVKEYAEALGVKYVNSIGKPFASGIKRLLKNDNLKPENVMMIGDQLITDVAAANRAHLRIIYTEKLVKEDQPTTRFNRIFERPKKRRLIKKHLLREWEEI
ncbi:MAG: YqeG family HAD IIIA-type phosphatase [Bacilli bacterium]|nr:YqeG family HAD IIIA-type phosphatase [Bacilli bacterium]